MFVFKIRVGEIMHNTACDKIAKLIYNTFDMIANSIFDICDTFLKT